MNFSRLLIAACFVCFGIFSVEPARAAATYTHSQAVAMCAKERDDNNAALSAGGSTLRWRCNDVPDANSDGLSGTVTDERCGWGGDRDCDITGGSWSYKDDPPPQQCTAGQWTPGVWTEPGAGTGCRNGCQTVPTLKSDDGITRFGMQTNGLQCSAATPPPPPEKPGPPPKAPGYTPTDPNDPSKGGDYCIEAGDGKMICTHGPAPNPGGDGGNSGGNNGGNNGGNGGNGGTGGNGGGNGGTGGDGSGGNGSGGGSGGGNGGGGSGGTGGGNGGNGSGGGSGDCKDPASASTAGGKSPCQPGGGTGGNGNGGNGNGNNGSGDDGKGKCTAGDACNNGNAAGVPSPDDFYKSDGKSVGDAFNDFAGEMSKAPIIQKARDFFVVSIGGSCPVWTVPPSKFTPPLVFDFHCRSPLSGALEAAGWVVLAIAVFHAFRVAVY